jgi:ubiquinol oxidase
MDSIEIDLKQEHAATLARAPYRYSALARVFFASMDGLVGATPTLGKVKLLELFAGVPYRACDAYHTALLTRRYREPAVVARAREVIAWGREAQDNELWHLEVIHALMVSEGQRDPWYHVAPLPQAMLATYRAFLGALTRVNPRRALRFNGEFEDHAEHSYANFVVAHPEWEQRPLPQGLAPLQAHTHLRTWADLFRRISLDERAHRDRSFEFAEARVPASDRDR